MGDVSEQGRADPWSRERASASALVLLMAIAGGLDAIAFLQLGGSFVGNQTGNVLLLGISLTRDSPIDTAATATSLGAFIVGAAALGRWRRTREERTPRRRPGLVIAVEASLLGLAATLSALFDPPAAVMVAPLALSMGLQAGLARELGVSYLTGGYITGSTTASAMGSPLGDRSDRWWWHGAIPLVTLASGAAGTAALARVSVPGALTLLAVGAAAAAELTRRHASAPAGGAPVPEDP